MKNKRFVLILLFASIFLVSGLVTMYLFWADQKGSAIGACLFISLISLGLTLGNVVVYAGKPGYRIGLTVLLILYTLLIYDQVTN
ncbi:hypothetical protein [Paenibacillus gansuensis]|uniref:Uncharacterized protein n=1 Tax=Paenibacillus gansuensis TaxID=306542 RepID=A0ABW5P6V4_9BACL